MPLKPFNKLYFKQNETEISNSTSNYKIIVNSDNRHSTLVVEEVFESTRAFYVCEAIQEGPTLKVNSKVRKLFKFFFFLNN